MAYNKAKEEYKWKVWKEQEEKKLRELGVSEEVIAELRDYDWNRHVFALFSTGSPDRH